MGIDQNSVTVFDFDNVGTIRTVFWVLGEDGK
jgi:hypothetical protein